CHLPFGAGRDVLDLGAEQLVQQRVSRRALGLRPVRDDHALHADMSRHRRRGARVVRLNAAHRDQRARGRLERGGGLELELPDLVAAEPKRNHVVALDEQARLAAAERQSEIFHLLERRGLPHQCQERRQLVHGCVDGLSPRTSRSASAVASRPRNARYMSPASMVPPRDRTMSRNRWPFARVMPPCSTNQAYASSLSTSAARYA